ncbi:G-patch domain [Trinorchestia longiramus]|nr:G-patch domain [Trinorchestia longiramus]
MCLETNNSVRFKPSDRLRQCSHCKRWGITEFGELASATVSLRLTCHTAIVVLLYVTCGCSYTAPTHQTNQFIMSASSKRSHDVGDGDGHKRKRARKHGKLDSRSSVGSSGDYYGNSSLEENVSSSDQVFSGTYNFIPGDSQSDYSPDAVTHFSSSFTDDNCKSAELSQSCDLGVGSMPAFITTSNNDHMDNSGPKYSSVAQKLMSKMGYEPGQGLGVSGSGRLEPVEASQQRGRRGLGHSVPKLKQAMDGFQWNKNLEHASVEEEVLWISQCPDPSPPSLNQMSDWIVLGSKKLEISDETTYCDEDVLLNVLDSKTVFDSLGEREIQRARVRSNPFETIGKVFFQNRAALKMANLDAITDMMFTKPTDDQGRSMVKDDSILYFADVCAAPGGFAEYAIWRRKTHSDGFPDVHGFGFTLRSNDFKLQDFYAAPREFFEPHYGESGKSGDGDIYKASNISNFCHFVKTATRGMGVHFMMADGGFSVDGQENIQEILSKQLYLGQFVVGLGIVREGGNFVCKLFDTFTPFTVGLIYLMYRCFKKVSIHKPNTSRPANSERYIICKWLRSGCEGVYSYLFEVNDKLNELKQSEMDVVHLVPPEIMEADTGFVQYIRDMNNTLGQRQIVSLQKIRVFCEDNNVVETRQGNLRTQSLLAWNVPDSPRMAPVRERPNIRAEKLLQECEITHEMLPSSLTEVKTVMCVQPRMHSAFDYRFVVSSVTKEERKNRGYYLGLGGMNVYRTESLVSPSWKRLDVKLELPPDTLIYAELVEEIHDMSVDIPLPCDEKAEKRRHKRVWALHVIDGIVLNGYNIHVRHLVVRHQFLRRFCEAVNKTSRNDLLQLRCKTLFRTEKLSMILAEPDLSVRQVKNSGAQRVLCCKPEGGFDSYHIPVTGLILLLSVKRPWMMAFSRTQGRKYFFNTMTKESAFETTSDKTADFISTMQGALFWQWRPGTAILGNDLNIGCDFLDSDDDEGGNRPELLSLASFAECVRRTPGMD